MFPHPNVVKTELSPDEVIAMGAAEEAAVLLARDGAEEDDEETPESILRGESLVGLGHHRSCSLKPTRLPELSAFCVRSDLS